MHCLGGQRAQVGTGRRAQVGSRDQSVSRPRGNASVATVPPPRDRFLCACLPPGVEFNEQQLVECIDPPFAATPCRPANADSRVVEGP